MKKFSVAALLLLSAINVRAHDFWIEPNKFVASPDDWVHLRLYQGQRLKGETLPYITDWFTAFDRIDASGRHRVVSQLGDDPAASLVLKQPGLAMVVYRSTRDFVEIDAKKFNTYLEDEGLGSIIDARAAKGETAKGAREYFSRCAKLLITVGDSSDDVIAKYDAGMTLELIPAKNPYRLKAGDALPLHVRYLDSGLKDATVIAFRRDHPDEQIRVKTDASGNASIPLSAPGVWLVKVVHMIPAPSDLDADWESFWASLVFEIQS